MLYKKLTFDQLHFTERDQKELVSQFENLSSKLGYGNIVDRNVVSNSFISYIYTIVPYIRDSLIIIKGTKDSDTILTPGRHIHTDDRYCALNIPLANCRQGADTVFYDRNSMKQINFPNPTGSTIFIKEENKDLVELGRFTLTMDSAYILDTTVPHCKIQTYPEHRLLLSCVIDIPFAEAVKYFE